MTLQQLRSFLTVEKYGSFSRASRELNLTQPCISKQIKALEEDVGSQLFYRLGRSVQLTESGEILHRYAQHVFQSIEDAQEAVDDLRGLHRGHLHISAASTMGIYTLPQALGEFKQLHPGVEIALDVTNKGRVLRQILDHEADLGFVGPPVRSSKLKREPYQADELFLIVSPSHRFAHDDRVSIYDLTEETFIVREPGSGTREILDEELTRLHVRLARAMELPSTEAIKRAVAANLGIAVVSKYAITLEIMTGRLCALEVKELNLRRQLYVIYHEDRPLKRVAQQFLTLVRQTAPAVEGVVPGQGVTTSP
ncbi:MAG: selenium metabolism-associated LysR family transcriptional regulator [Candidatus Methylomirabilales bacterium]